MTTRHDQIISIIREVAIRHNVLGHQIMGPRVYRHIAYARMEAMHRIRNEVHPRVSLPHIGKIFDRHHTTVLAAILAVDKHMRRSGAWPVTPKAGRRSRIITDDFEPGPIHLRMSRAELDPAPLPPPPERLVMRPCRAVNNAARINEYWRARGINANARAVRDGRRIVIRSDIDLREVRA